MARRLPDLSELTKKLDVQRIVSDIKSLITPGTKIPEAPEGNELAEKLAELIGVVNQVADTHAQQAKEIARVSNQLNALYKYTVAQAEGPQRQSKAGTAKTQQKRTTQQSQAKQSAAKTRQTSKASTQKRQKKSQSQGSTEQR